MLRASNQEEHASGQTVILCACRSRTQEASETVRICRQKRVGGSDVPVQYTSSMQEAACPCYALGITVAETNQDAVSHYNVGIMGKHFNCRAYEMTKYQIGSALYFAAAYHWYPVS